MSASNVSGYNDILPIDKLYRLAEENAEQYRTASPHAHGVFDNVFEPSILHAILDEFAAKEKDKWKEYDNQFEKKMQLSTDETLGPYTRAFIHSLNSGAFLNFLEKLTGIPSLIPDPYLAGGGLHKIKPGGKLGIHVDFSYNDILHLYRRINVLVYLNEDWEDSYGGHFELWSDKNGSEKKKILPIFNRMAIFNTTATSFHGHPEPLNCPPDRCRHSIALYYYTVDKGEDHASRNHGTVFVDEQGKRVEPGKKPFIRKLKDGLKETFR